MPKGDALTSKLSAGLVLDIKLASEAGAEASRKPEDMDAIGAVLKDIWEAAVESGVTEGLSL